MCLSASVSTSILFCIAHYIRDFVSGNLRPASFFFFLALLLGSFVNHIGNKYMTKEKYHDLLVFITWLTINSVFSVLNSQISWFIGITRPWRILEYCGDWLLWGLLAHIAWSIIFCNEDLDKTFKEIDASNKKK